MPLTNAFCELSLLLLTSYSQGVERVQQGESYLRSHDTTVIFIFLPPFFFFLEALANKSRFRLSIDGAKINTPPSQHYFF